MTHNKIGSRFVVIGRAATAGKKTRRELPIQRAAARRIVLIRNGELVDSRQGR